MKIIKINPKLLNIIQIYVRQKSAKAMASITITIYFGHQQYESTNIQTLYKVLNSKNILGYLFVTMSPS